MKDLLVATVRTGTVYDFQYVVKMRNMVQRHLMLPYTFVNFTDQPERAEGIHFIDVSAAGLPGWWAKMLIFEPQWRGDSKVVYLDIDTVVIGDLSPLAAVPGEFSICENFTRLLTNPTYPCRYNSSCMVIGPAMGSFIWNSFDRRRDLLMMTHARHGDQKCIEELYPSAQLLQRMVPPLFFCNYRQLTNHPPRKASIINFGGNHKPHNCPIPWVQEAWV